jgi:hypothetical protein
MLRLSTLLACLRHELYRLQSRSVRKNHRGRAQKLLPPRLSLNACLTQPAQVNRKRVSVLADVIANMTAVLAKSKDGNEKRVFLLYSVCLYSNPYGNAGEPASAKGQHTMDNTGPLQARKGHWRTPANRVCRVLPLNPPYNTVVNCFQTFSRVPTDPGSDARAEPESGVCRQRVPQRAGKLCSERATACTSAWVSADF